MAGKIFRNGVAYGDGGSAVPDAVLQIKVGDERYDPVNGVADLSDTCKAYNFYIPSNAWDSDGDTEVYVKDTFSYNISRKNYNEIVLSNSITEGSSWRDHNIRVTSVGTDSSNYITEIDLSCDPDNKPTNAVYFTIISRTCPTASGYLSNLYEPIGVYIDSELDATSTYPVQNKVIAAEINKINAKVPDKIEVSSAHPKITDGLAIDVTFQNAPSGFSGDYVWTDGGNIYYSNDTSQYVFDKANTTWSSKTWSGLTDFDGRYVWTDGVDIYYSKSSEQYVLNKSTSTWSAKTWTGLTSFYGGDIWTDGNNIYRSNGSNQYVLDKSTSTWSTKTWAGLTSFYGSPIWSDGENIYYSSGTSQYILNKETSTWSTKTWGGLTNINGSSVWTDGNDIYYSYSTNDRYVLDRSTDTWYAKKWNGVPTNFNGLYIWTDGDNIYYSSDTTHKKLIPSPKIKSTKLR